ncbi:hypothetical protein Q3V30_07640 [Erwinia pyri]|uniref:Uncharacterized protein n=1 Tax=Erwinia pyri TaxID=3062598 RepID=A0AA50HRU0_9GAMM|nr:hypothetical protein [Erwinia sp. DE2]WLS80345.1 hypothetical protein Q3V30_07640 [Erwinia sp. DE2]
MKYLLLILSLFSSVTTARQMEGFGANYYQDDSFIPEYDTNKNFVPDVIIGNNVYVMEFNSLADIAKILA